MANTIIGVFDDYTHAQNALSALTQIGLERSAINLSPSDQSYSSRQSVLRRGASDEDETEGWNIGNFFRSLFGTSDNVNTHTDIYSEAIRRGSYLLSVDVDNQQQHDRALEVLNQNQPVDIDDRAAQWKTRGWSSYDSNAPVLSEEEIARERSSYSTTPTRENFSPSANAATSTNETRIPVVEEELKVGKREVDRGGIRVFQRVSEKPVHEQVQLREENINVERRPVNQPATTADLAAFKEGSIELRETGEEPVIEKTARVVEEVVVGKQVTERTQNIDDSVRRTNVDVEKIGGNTGFASASDDVDFRNHWQSSYAHLGGRYEDYAPSYQYGSRLAGNPTYKNSRWDEIEPQVRQDWESNNRSSSTWENAKDAVRTGWEKITR